MDVKCDPACRTDFQANINLRYCSSSVSVYSWNHFKRRPVKDTSLNRTFFQQQPLLYSMFNNGTSVQRTLSSSPLVSV